MRMFRYFLLVLFFLGMNNAFCQQSFEWHNINIPNGYKLAFKNKSYHYYKKGENVFALSFKNNIVHTITFTDKKLFNIPYFEKWRDGNGGNICVYDDKDFIVWQIEKEKHYVIFNKNNL